MIGVDGHLKLTDFGLAADVHTQRCRGKPLNLPLHAVRRAVGRWAQLSILARLAFVAAARISPLRPTPRSSSLQQKLAAHLSSRTPPNFLHADRARYDRSGGPRTV